MTNHTKETDFLQLCNSICELDSKVEDVREVEPLMVQVIDLVNNNQEHRSVFVRLFLDIAKGNIELPPYALPFFMRELRYSEIRDYLLEETRGDQTKESFRRKMNFVSDVMHAFDDHIWQDADIWPYYSRK